MESSRRGPVGVAGSATRRLAALCGHVKVREERPDAGLCPEPTAATPALGRALKASYDYIVVGAGSAGCVVASRLSEDPSVSVLLVEAGGNNQSFQVRSPFIGYATMQNTNKDWAFRTARQAGADDRVSHWPRGKVLGGCSSINSMIYCRGDPRNYDSWAQKLGCEGWSYEDVLPYFKKSENLLGVGNADVEAHGRGGPLEVTQMSEHEWTLKATTERFLQSCEAAGLPRNDYNGRTQRGASFTQTTIKDGVRCDTASAFLFRSGALERPNLTVLTDGMVTRVVLQGQEATGVCIQKSKSEPPLMVDASREVILSCGTVGTPHLLMLSGVGPQAHLREHGIGCVSDLPVGENLQDHLFWVVGYRMKEGVPSEFTAIRPFSGAIKNLAKHLLFGTGLMSLCPIQAMAFDHSGLEGSDEAEGNDMQIHFLGFSAKGIDPEKAFGIPLREDRPLSNPANDLVSWEGISVLPTLVLPKSRGSVRLASADPEQPPVIDPRYLSDPHDLDICVATTKLVRKICSSPPLSDILGAEVVDPSIKSPPESDEYIREHVRRGCVTVYHPTSTARMGPADDPNAVVDLRLRVRGVRRLRIADASVMPAVISGNTNAPAIMIGERLAAFIQEERGRGAA